MTTNRTVLIGADPELFLMDAKENLISAIGKIGGSKNRPRPIGKGCKVQEDNVAVEFNIVPAETKDQFIRGINHALEYLTTYAGERDLFLNISAAAVFDAKQLKHPKAKVFGCDPDYNCWTGLENPRPNAKNKKLRSCGGHIHIGGVSDMSPIQLARHCDISMGLPSVLEDEDKLRRELYGKAGSFRRKEYGIEYRTLSNYWLQSPELMEAVFQRAQHAAEMCGYGWEISDEEGDAIQAAINNSDKDKAKELMSQYGVD